VFPVGIGLRDPRSQKRDLGHPSISPFDIAESTCYVISLASGLDLEVQCGSDQLPQAEFTVLHVFCWRPTRVQTDIGA
jgi:hypothetical protein